MAGLVNSLFARKTIHALHIRKTGGTAFRHAVYPYRFNPFRRPAIRICKHKVTFPSVIESDADGMVFFIVRDPATRFVSGVNSRLRRGYPRYNNSWSPVEAHALGIFRTPNELAEGLSSSDPVRQRDAEWTMLALPNTSIHMKRWLVSNEFLEQHKENIFYLAAVETLEQDFENMKILTGLPASAHLPDDEVERHSTPDSYSAELSDEALRNIKRYYSEDFKIYEWCLEFRKKKGWPGGSR